MRTLAQKKGARIVCFVLCLVFTVLAGASWCLSYQCWTRGWYEASPFSNNGTSFADSDYASDYVNDCIWYTAQYIQWLGKITEDVVSGYGGDSIAVLICDEESGEIILDTRKPNSEKVYAEALVTFADGGTQRYNELLAEGDEAALMARQNHNWRISGYVNLPVKPYEGCYTEYLYHEILLAVRPFIIPLTALLAVVALVFAAGLVWITLLHEPGKRHFFDRVPLELLVVGELLLCLGLKALLRNLGQHALHERLGDALLYFELSYGGLRRILMVLCWTAAGLLVVWSVLRRIRRHELRQSSLCIRMPAVWRMAALMALAAVFALGWIYAWAQSGWDLTIPVLVLVLTALATAHAVVLAVQFGRLEKAARELAAGQLDYQVATHGLMSGLREQGEALNSIGAGMKTAVDEQMKGERFKTELITNVSHDLKTPLTSIVSYVDLLKKEDVPSPTAREYIEVIDRQSAKLKKLTEDLVEASRASSGAIAVHPEPTDVRELLSQSVGEYTERLAANGIEAMLALPQRGVVLDTDGRLLWRVLENLLQNIAKYAQPGTRAYVDLTCEGGHMAIALKNTSAEALNIPAEELMERFVRGDASRHTEGSGLGLSIAQSLTELLGGTMALYLDGDLFKVTLSFEGAREEC